MKVLTNWRDSVCLDCGIQGTAVGLGSCSFCGSGNLTDLKGGEFTPKFITDRRCRDWVWKPERRWDAAM